VRVWRLGLVLALACAACTGDDDASPPSTTTDPARFDAGAADECRNAEDSGRYDGDLVAAFDSTVGDVAAAFTPNNDPGFIANPDDESTVCWFDDGSAGQVVIFINGNHAGVIPAERVPERP
jgi:hypothetical protein